MSASNLVLIDKAVTSQWVTTTCPESRFYGQVTQTHLYKLACHPVLLTSCLPTLCRRHSSPLFLHRHCAELNKQAGEVELREVLGDAAICESVEFDARELYFAAGGADAVGR